MKLLLEFREKEKGKPWGKWFKQEQEFETTTTAMCYLKNCLNWKDRWDERQGRLIEIQSKENELLCPHEKELK